MGEAENVRDRLARLLPKAHIHDGRPFAQPGFTEQLYLSEPAAVALADRLERAAEVERERDELLAAVGRVRALHKARPVGAFDYCEHCEWTWPCPTIRVIEATP